MVMAQTSCRKVPKQSLSHAQPLARRLRSSSKKDVLKLQQLLHDMDINKKCGPSRRRAARKATSNPGTAAIPGCQAPDNSPEICSSSLISGYSSSSPPSSLAVRAASPSTYTPVHASTTMFADTPSMPNNNFTHATLPVPPPPWLSAPPLPQYTIDSIISDMGGFSIEHHPAAPEELTASSISPVVTTRWLPSASAAEEPEDGSYDMSILQDALDSCGRVPEPNGYIHLDYHPAPRTPPYRRPEIDYSISPYAPPPLEVGKVRKTRGYKTSSAPYSREPELRRKRRYSSDSDQSNGQGCPSNIPPAVAHLPYLSQRRTMPIHQPSYHQPPPVYDPYFPAGSDYWP